ncbi:zinc finger protein 543-like [Ischnura elegans]|uniref:zinc finger protein 543-like n=1 Tax=Ischnura elegans TaxID=197161 RepID=UPI001ED8749C|nr:zinc finger protein 543-like [Ischnura elegans]
MHKIHPLPYAFWNGLRSDVFVLSGCVQCGKGFTKSSHLKRHCITHTNERPYPCAVCRKGFVESSYLNRHMAVHTGTDEGIRAVEYAAQEGRREYVCFLFASRVFPSVATWWLTCANTAASLSCASTAGGALQ